MTKLVLIVYGLMWVSVSIPVSIGIYLTHNINCLWFLIIPALIRVKTKDEGDEDEE